MNPPHANATNELAEWSLDALPRGLVRVSIQASIRIPWLDSMPEPDIAWLARKDYFRQHPTPADIHLIIEVADTSLAKDQGEKSELYAEAGIRDYWIVDLINRRVEVRRDPAGTTYRTITTHAIGDEVRPLAFPEIALPVARLFPD